MRVRILFAFLCLTVHAWAQGAVTLGTPILLDQNGHLLQNALVAVCANYPGLTPDPPCNEAGNSLITTYTDITLATVCSGPAGSPLNNINVPSVGNGCSNPGTPINGNVVAYALGTGSQKWCEFYGSGINVLVLPCVFPQAANLVTSVFGRTGAVVATTGDYTCAQVTSCPPSQIAGGIGADTTERTVNAATTSWQVFSTLGTLGTGALNTLNKTVHLHLTGNVTSVQNSSVNAFPGLCFTNGGTTVHSFFTLPASLVSGASFDVEVDCSTNATGTNGTLLCGGIMNYDSGGWIVTGANGQQTSPIDLTGSVSVGGCIAFSTASTSNVANQISANSQQTF